MKKLCKVWFLLITGVCASLHSQTYVSLSIEKLEKIENGVGLEITISNNSSETYVIPIDTVGFKTYFRDNPCTEFDLIRNYPDLGFVPMIMNNDNSFVDAMSADKGTLIKQHDIFSKSDKKYKKEQKRILKSWKKKNQLNDKDIEWIKINHYLYTHLVTLQPQQKISYKTSINFHKINEQSDIYLYYFYPLETNTEYQMFLKLCTDESIYQYLTKEQQQRFKDYTFFTGELLSNAINLRNWDIKTAINGSVSDMLMKK